MPQFSYPPKSVLIIGASARAAAQSANSAGYDCFAIDLFGDVDTRKVCVEVAKVDRLEEATRLARRFPADTFLYTGCVENRTHLINRLSQNFALAGNGFDSIQKVRDPFWLQQLGKDRDFLFPQTMNLANTQRLREGPWLRKPFAGGSGRGIKSFATDAAKTEGDPPHDFVQKQIDGEPYSAAFISNHSDTILIGTSRQILNTDGIESERFHNHGSIGPLDPGPAVRGELKRIGNIIANDAGLRGLFGIDFVLSGESIHVIEVNPRYTASMELFEERCATTIVDLHLKACFGMSVELLADRRDKVLCKLIHFSQRVDSFAVSECFEQWIAELSAAVGSIRDIPKSGTQIEPGQPVFTCIASGDSADEALVACQQLADEAFQVAIGKAHSSN